MKNKTKQKRNNNNKKQNKTKKAKPNLTRFRNWSGKMFFIINVSNFKRKC